MLYSCSVSMMYSTLPSISVPITRVYVVLYAGLVCMYIHTYAHMGIS